MMTIDEVIAKYESDANFYEFLASCKNKDESSREYFKTNEANYRQIAEWLKKLKRYDESSKKHHQVDTMLHKELENAENTPYILKPTSYALYQVWRWFDKHEEKRELVIDSCEERKVNG